MSRSERTVAFVSAVTLLCSTLEFLIPKPLPFLRLGLANLPLLIILDTIGLRSYLAILLLKAIGQGMVSGTLFSYLILVSLSGTLASGLAMYGAKRLLASRVSLVGISLIGAFVSNLSQIAVAAAVVYGSAIWIAAPLMLALGLATSLVLGILAEHYRRTSTFAPLLTDPTFTLSQINTERRQGQSVATIAVMVTIAAIITADGLASLVAIVVVLYAMQKACNRKIRLAPALALLLSLLLLSLAEPNGRVLLALGHLAVTETALTNALLKALRLIALLSASQALVGTNPPLRGKAGSILVLTLAYFGRLTHAFGNTTGTIVSRIDQALLATAGEREGEQAVIGTTRPVHTPIVVVLATVVVAVAAVSRLW
ncbi:MAG: Gx transporter family protein [Sphaerochaeta sp.]|nr:Gx transporter family protein [Sphaerochaeta sp.]